MPQKSWARAETCLPSILLICQILRVCRSHSFHLGFQFLLSRPRGLRSAFHASSNGQNGSRGLKIDEKSAGSKNHTCKNALLIIHKQHMQTCAEIYGLFLQSDWSILKLTISLAHFVQKEQKLDMLCNASMT